jgi:carbohydrate binding protein with CBM35 domain/carbohydrate binding protein with CBM6 domain
VNVTGPLSVPNTGGYQTWTTISKSGLNLAAGPHVLRVVFDSAVTGGTAAGNFNFFSFVKVNSATTIEAESCTLSQAVVATNHTGFSGTGFVDYNNVVGGFVECTISAAAAGNAALAFRYANGTTANRPMSISVNGTVVNGNLAFNPTTNWDTWATQSINVTLSAGANTIRATATTAGGGPNLDRITIQ